MKGGIKEDPRLILSVANDGTVNLLCIRAEMGQGVRTGWATVVADELEADMARVKVLQAQGDEARYGNQDTDGSRSMRHHFLALRRMAAAVRQMLEQEAANRWNVPVAEVKAQNHEVVHAASGRRVGFGELRQVPRRAPVPAREALVLKTPDRFRYIGKDTALVDNLDFTTGKAQYGIDARLDGMAYAVVARPPVFGGKVKSFDAAETMKVPGVLKVVPIDAPPTPPVFMPLGGIAVVAENTFAAIKGRSRLKIQWDDGPNGSYDSVEFRKTMEAAAAKPGKVVRNNGDVDKALAGAARRIDASYYIPHLAHATMEPPSATARVTDAGCEIWASTQNPEAIRGHLAKGFNMPIDKIVVNVLFLGGGFGRKSKGDFAIEAAILSRAMGGRPVKVTFTREDDLQNGFFHTVSVERLEAGLDANGKPVAWLHRTVAPTILSTFAPDQKHEAPFELGMGAVDTPFAIPNLRVENPEATAHTRIGWLRSVSNIPHAFAVQSFVAELAAALGRDPKDYLLELIGPDRLIDAGAMSDAWIHGEDPKLYPFDTGRLRRRRKGGERGGLGAQAAGGKRPRHRRAPELRELRRVRGRGGGQPQGRAHDPARRLRLRLRRRDQSRSRACAARGLRGAGRQPRDPGRDQLQERPHRADQLRRLRADPHRCRTEGDPHAPGQHDRLRQAAGRRRRTRRPAGRAGSGQRDLRRLRQTHPHAADPRPALGEGVRRWRFILAPLGASRSGTGRGS